uniref:Uncharacterized protein n=1 Tax=Arundo donax TaxID=35708 RepID=A0A0A9EG36_ARUDO
MFLKTDHQVLRVPPHSWHDRQNLFWV